MSKIQYSRLYKNDILLLLSKTTTLHEYIYISTCLYLTNKCFQAVEYRQKLAYALHHNIYTRRYRQTNCWTINPNRIFAFGHTSFFYVTSAQTYHRHIGIHMLSFFV